MPSSNKKLSAVETEKLLHVLKARFEKHASRHKGLTWATVQKKLEAKPEKLAIIHEMEKTGGEPDVVVFGKKSSDIVFVDCSAESPAGRRSFCYDHAALNARKEHKPKNSAMHLASEMGVELLSEEQYRELQTMGEFDLKTSSWVATPSIIRKHGGAIFCDRRYGHVFTYHNGADSYYAARGFRGALRI